MISHVSAKAMRAVLVAALLAMTTAPVSSADGAPVEPATFVKIYRSEGAWAGPLSPAADGGVSFVETREDGTGSALVVVDDAGARVERVGSFASARVLWDADGASYAFDEATQTFRRHVPFGSTAVGVSLGMAFGADGMLYGCDDAQARLVRVAPDRSAQPLDVPCLRWMVPAPDGWLHGFGPQFERLRVDPAAQLTERVGAPRTWSPLLAFDADGSAYAIARTPEPETEAIVRWNSASNTTEVVVPATTSNVLTRSGERLWAVERDGAALAVGYYEVGRPAFAEAAPSFAAGPAADLRFGRVQEEPFAGLRAYGAGVDNPLSTTRTLTIHLVNAGGGAAPATVLDVERRNATLLGRADAWRLDVPPLAPGERATLRVTYDRSGAYGEHVFELTLDAQRQLIEEDERDNRATFTTSYAYKAPL